jgi:hypothetical protein
MQDAALMTYGVLRAEVEESLHAVGYFTQGADRSERRYIYKSPLIDEMYDEASLIGVLEDAF